jgi:NitT/TauT family transport system ATP-binding protein
MKNPDIVASDIAVSFKQGKKSFLAIENVSFKCEQGKFISILGPSGCGKSTLLQVLAGLLKPEDGTLWRNPERIKKGVGYIPQSPQLLPWRTLLQNSFIASELTGHKYNKVDIGRVKSLINTFRLTGFENSYPHELSGGMAQRVSLIRALQARPAIIFCDEPFSAIDFVSRFELNIAFKNECLRNKVTCVMITHNIEEAIYMSDKIIMMGGSPGKTYKEYERRPLPKYYDPILCRQSVEFNDFFNDIWRDLNDSYKLS